MFCQYCLSSEPAPLVGMQSNYLVQNGLQISYLDCFKQCKHIKIEDEHTAKICTSCIPMLNEDYTLKLWKDEFGTSIKEEPGLNFNSWCIPATSDAPEDKYDTTEPRLRIEESGIKAKSTIEANLIVFPVAQIKEEAELQISENDESSMNFTRSSAPG
jgi:hypothetical protein